MAIVDYITGKAFRGSGDDDAQDARDAALAELEGVQLPRLKDVNLESAPWLQDLKASTVEGVDPLTAERAQYYGVDGTAFDDVSADPRLKDQQMAALASLTDVVDGGGMTATDQANLSRIQTQSATADRGRREAILQNASARGMGGSGMELLAQLDSSQAATDRQAQQGLDIAGMAQQRALDAMMQRGGMAGGMRDQDFGEQARIAQARDSINTFNANNQNQNAQFNVGQGNNMGQFNAGMAADTQRFNANQTQSANQFNVGGRQGQSNLAADAKNKGTMYNAGLSQQQFGNKMQKATGKATLYGQQADADTARANANQAGWQNFLGGAAKVGAAVATGGASLAAPAAAGAVAANNEDEDEYTSSDERGKKDIKDVDSLDMDAFLATIAPKKFKYKDKANGDGDRTGVMAQDLLKSKLGAETVVQSDEGTLSFNKDKMQGVLLAAIKHLSDKIDKKGN